MPLLITRPVAFKAWKHNVAFAPRKLCQINYTAIS